MVVSRVMGMGVDRGGPRLGAAAARSGSSRSGVCGRAADGSGRDGRVDRSAFATAARFILKNEVFLKQFCRSK